MEILDEQKIEQNFLKFINLLETNVHRDGVEKLIKWLKSKDTKYAPASTKYHLSCKGGLVQHCLNVYERLIQLLNLEYPESETASHAFNDSLNSTSPYTLETITIVALLHDLSKVDFYEIQERNAKDENGNWVKVPYYAIKDEQSRFIYGSHSMNSVYMLSKFFPLSYEESLAILHHMGGYDYTEDSLSVKNISEAYAKSQLALLLHVADLQATYISDKRTINE